MIAIANPPSATPIDEIERRMHAVRNRADAAGLGGVLGFADCWRTANARYFTDYRPVDGVHDTALALMWLPNEGEPTLFVGDACLPTARSLTHFAVEAFAELERVLGAWAGTSAAAPAGLAGYRMIPTWLEKEAAAALGAVPLVPTMVLAEEKARKSPFEVEQMRQAARLTDYAMEVIRDKLVADGPVSERDLARAADAAMVAAGSDGPAYLSMVQFGSRSAFQLALPTDRVLQPGDLVNTDVGARFGNYTADGARGFAYGKVSERQREIIETAADVVEIGLGLARPGITASDLNGAMQKELIDRGFGPYSAEAMGRGTGHGTGMDPEEELPWIGPGDPTVLEEDMVFTLKATILVPDAGGLRTERIVRLTADGAETLDNFPMRNYW